MIRKHCYRAVASELARHGLCFTVQSPGQEEPAVQGPALPPLMKVLSAPKSLVDGGLGATTIPKTKASSASFAQLFRRLGLAQSVSTAESFPGYNKPQSILIISITGVNDQKFPTWPKPQPSTP
ncbi:hypothetical protein DUI87_14175 [Hirundo rustica rustica]|uniref:Uncharacterized protein n=1 Tax=Hirundo rustica rustica TaxID=333673 RepID=A0A3M0K7M5_HIRRU|nr:hypothetical protein DUI87_14175 [Hirundo rustica rustica]